MPQVFPPGADISHAEWLHAISTLDGAIAISKAVMDDFVIWQTEHLLHETPRRPFIHNWFHLGSDLSASAPTLGVPQTAQSLLGELKKTHTFLMVGTIEPRKAHIQVLEAFTLLWSQGHDIHLVIVGQEGWMGLDDAQRRDIPEVVRRLNSHPENKRHLHWLKGISDEYLEKIYEASACLIAASWGEGFGLPLVEAANHQVPVLARDIPVFREVAGLNATYFTAKSALELSNAVQAWVKQQTTKQVTDLAITQLTWSQSVQQICSSILVQAEQE
jgi:glycosyltransferase involved in cell wall biosynthesis